MEQGVSTWWAVGTTLTPRVRSTPSTLRWTPNRRTARDVNTDTLSTQSRTPSPSGQNLSEMAGGETWMQKISVHHRLIGVPPPFRTRDIKPDEPTMLFVTKCPCDECIPLIRGAGITHIYTSDQDRDKDKGDISYLRFGTLRNISKFIVSPQCSSCFVFVPFCSYSKVQAAERGHFLSKHSKSRLGWENMLKREIYVNLFWCIISWLSSFWMSCFLKIRLTFP